MTTYSDIQLDALRELANIGSGSASTALSTMLGKPTDISVPTVAALPLEEAVAIAGEPEDLRFAVMVPIIGDFEATVVLLFPEDDARVITSIYGLEPDTPDGHSMLQEMGNILGTSYINVLAQMVGLDLEPEPPQVVCDMLGAVVASVLLGRGEDPEAALVMDSALSVEGEESQLSFLLLPTQGGVLDLLSRLGL